MLQLNCWGFFYGQFKPLNLLQNNFILPFQILFLYKIFHLVNDYTTQETVDIRFRRSEPISKKLLKFVDKISKSRYFQQATDYRYIKKAMEEVSNTRLILNVEMKAVVGTLAVNIPPPPTNRIWCGFASKCGASFIALQQFFNV